MGLLKILRKIHLTATRSCARNQQHKHYDAYNQEGNTLFHYYNCFNDCKCVMVFYLHLLWREKYVL